MPERTPTFYWAALGLATPRAVTLSPAARARLTHMAELRDVSSPGDAQRAGAEYARERHLAPDLLRVRPWLAPDTPARQVVTAVLNTEWTGFLALLGEHGPWVYAGSVRDLQELAEGYGALVRAASTATDDIAFQAAQATPDSLLTRLEATDYRVPGNHGAAPGPLERAFWQDTHREALRRRQQWLQRHGPSR